MINIKPLSSAQLDRLADCGPELLAVFEHLTFTAETVAHLRGLEHELLPTTDKARELIAQVKG